MTATLMETYLGRDAGQRVLGGRIMRGIAEHIDAVVWFSDLRGFTQITDTEPKQAIPLLNDYSDTIFLAIHQHGGDVLKLIGDGTLAIFTAEDRLHACSAALSAAIDARKGIAELKNGGRQPASRSPTCISVCMSASSSTAMSAAASAWTSPSSASRQRGKPYSCDVPFARSAGSDVGGVRGCRRHQAPLGFGRPLCAARRRASAGAVYAGSRCVSAVEESSRRLDGVARVTKIADTDELVGSPVQHEVGCAPEASLGSRTRIAGRRSTNPGTSSPSCTARHCRNICRPRSCRSDGSCSPAQAALRRRACCGWQFEVAGV